MTNIKLNSIERPCQTSAASQIVCSVFKNRIYTFEEKYRQEQERKTARARDTHKNINFGRTMGRGKQEENIVDQLIFVGVWNAL
jgi:hypothetical protein